MQDFTGSTNLDAAKSAILKGNKVLARQLLRTEIRQNPSADAWYLVSLVCTSKQQEIHALERAINLDPFHEEAGKALWQIREQTHSPSSTLFSDFSQHNKNLLQEIALIFRKHDWNVKIYTDNLLQVEKKKPVNSVVSFFVILFLGLLGTLLVCVGIASASTKTITITAMKSKGVEVTDGQRQRRINQSSEIIPLADDLYGGISYAGAILFGIVVTVISLPLLS